MNKWDKIIALALGLCLAGWLWHSVTEQKKAAEAAREAAAAAPAAQQASAGAPAAEAKKDEAKIAASAPAVEEKKVFHTRPEKLVSISNAQEVVVLSSYGAAVKEVSLLGYARDCGEISDENPPVKLDFVSNPALAAEGDFDVVSSGPDHVVFRNAEMERKVTLGGDYKILVEEKSLTAKPLQSSASLGVMAMGAGKNDLLSIDARTLGPKGAEVMHYGEEEPLESYLVSSSGGCSGAKNAAGVPETQSVPVSGPCSWVAVKNRFFVTAICSLGAPAKGFTAGMTRDASVQEYVLKSVSAKIELDASQSLRSYTFYAGPKKQELLWNLDEDMQEVMEFGMWSWVCYPLVWVLNLFHSWVPSYGIGIILLTILVRLVFWPLTHKSTISMRRMSEIQPKMKELREKFKDNPQRLQQETWALYRDNKVNPMASCLPMLVQIPVFIALFTVLRSAVELRYAPFLWIADLSEPENLFPGIFGFIGGLNILPILMAVTMGLQSALTPSTGDKQQQRMMMVFMPVMMLVMFYSFPSALSLYWTLSQVLSIVQMYYIRKKYTPAPPAASADTVDATVVTRQMRRHSVD